MESHKSFRIRPFHAPCGNRCGKLRLGMPDPRKSPPSLNFIEASRIRFCGKYGPQAMASQAKLPVGRIKCGWPERAVSEPIITTARRRKPAWGLTQDFIVDAIGLCLLFIHPRRPEPDRSPICRDYACMISSFARARPWARPQTQTLSC